MHVPPLAVTLLALCGAVVAALFAGCGLLWLAGAPLNAWAARRLAAQPRLDTASLGHSIEGRLYLLVLGFGVALFHLALPLLLLVSLTLMLALPAILFISWPLASCALFVAGLWGSVSAAIGLFGGMAREEGRLATREENPRLFAALGEVAAVASAPVPAQVRIVYDDQLAVADPRRLLEVLFTPPQATLYLSHWLMSGLTASELKCLLAHELGHIAQGDTRLLPWIARTLDGIEIIRRLVFASRGAARLAPSTWFARLFARAFAQVSLAFSRRGELLADLRAANAWGGDEFTRAFCKAVEAMRNFRALPRLREVLMRNLGAIDQPYAALRAAYDAVPGALQGALLDVELSRPASPLSTHPADRERLARVAGIRGERAHDNEPSLLLLGESLRGAPARFPRAPGWEKRSPRQQLELAAAVGLYDAAQSVSDEPTRRGLTGMALERARDALGLPDLASAQARIR